MSKASGIARQLMDHIIENAWRDGWDAGYSAGREDGRWDGTSWCDKDADWEKFKAKIADSTPLDEGRGL